MQRCECERPGVLIIIVVKSLPRFRKIDNRITADRQQGNSTRLGYGNNVHVAVDDTSRLAYVKLLAEEQKQTVIGILSREVATFNALDNECQRVMSVNVSKAIGQDCLTLIRWHIPTRPYIPNQRLGLAIYSYTLSGMVHHGLSALRRMEPRSGQAPGEL